MEMNEGTGQFGMKYACQVIRASETQENKPKDEQHHSQEKVIVGMFPNRAGKGWQASSQNRNDTLAEYGARWHQELRYIAEGLW